MLIYDFRTIGNKLLAIRKRSGMTQMEVAVAAEISERTYADIERGSVNMRLGTLLQICRVLHITPDEILLEKEEPVSVRQKELLAKLETCSPKERELALRVLAALFEK